MTRKSVITCLQEATKNHLGRSVSCIWRTDQGKSQKRRCIHLMPQGDAAGGGRQEGNFWRNCHFLQEVTVATVTQFFLVPSFSIPSRSVLFSFVPFLKCRPIPFRLVPFLPFPFLRLIPRKKTVTKLLQLALCGTEEMTKVDATYRWRNYQKLSRRAPLLKGFLAPSVGGTFSSWTKPWGGSRVPGSAYGFSFIFFLFITSLLYFTLFGK